MEMVKTALNGSYLAQVREVAKANNNGKLCAIDQSGDSKDTEGINLDKIVFLLNELR